MNIHSILFEKSAINYFAWLDLFGVPSRFLLFSLYFTAFSSWLKVGPVLEINRSLQCCCTVGVFHTFAALKLVLEKQFYVFIINQQIVLSHNILDYLQDLALKSAHIARKAKCFLHAHFYIRPLQFF